MRIVDLKTFLAMPEGTVFMKYKPCFSSKLCVKGGTLENDFTSDFICAAIIGEIEAESSDEYFAKLTAAGNTSASISMDFDGYIREGCDPKQLFAIYEKQDIEGLIAKLQECKEKAYDKKTKRRA